MITTTYNFSSGTGFLYDSSKIGFSGGSAKLVLQTNPFSFIPSVSASTFDPSLLQFTSSTLNQINQSPANSTFYAAWSTIINGNWGGGSLVGTPINGAAISGARLDLTGATGKYVEYSATGNSDSLQVGAVKFKVTPNYSGAPGTFQIFWATFTTANSANNNIEIYHAQTSGNLHVLINNPAGSVIVNQDFGNWNPTSGTEYEMELDWDITTGATRLFINGVQFGSTATQTGTRAATLIMRVGAEYVLNGVVSANFKIRQLIVFSAVQHTANYTPGYSYSDTLYDYAVANLPLLTYGGPGNVSAFTGFSTVDMGGTQYTIGGKYWNGSAWVSSNESYAQSNSAATINSNIATFTPANSLQINAIYAGSNMQQSLTSIELDYSAMSYPLSNPTIAPNAPITMDQLSAFTDVQSASGSDGIQFYLMIGSNPYWWNGSAWVISNATYAQSNIAADIQTNAATLPITLGAFLTPYALLHSASGNTTPSLTSVTLTYDYFGPEPTPPNVCTVFGYFLDEKEQPIVGATIAVTNPTTFINQGIVIAQGVRTTTTDSIGYFSMTLVETASLSGANPLQFDVTYTQQQVGAGFTPVTYSFGSADIPNTPEANITSLVFS